jgi:transcriptional regulator with XRE-family HTH domain
MNDQESRGGGGGGVTNPEVAKRLGLSESGVHRIRNGTRYPSLNVMRRIAAEYDWPLEEQLSKIPADPTQGRTMEYAHELERRISRKH